MATMTLPIRELELSVCVGTEKARAETECVAFYSSARVTSPSFSLTIKLGFAVSLLRWLLRRLAGSQRTLIRMYQDTDFTCCSNDEIMRVAKSLDSVVERGRATLIRLEALEPRTHAWLGVGVLAQLGQQLEHLDSIAESLHLAADAEGTALMAMAVDEFAAAAEFVA